MATICPYTTKCAYCKHSRPDPDRNGEYSCFLKVDLEQENKEKMDKAEFEKRYTPLQAYHNIHYHYFMGEREYNDPEVEHWWFDRVEAALEALQLIKTKKVNVALLLKCFKIPDDPFLLKTNPNMCKGLYEYNNTYEPGNNWREPLDIKEYNKLKNIFTDVKYSSGYFLEDKPGHSFIRGSFETMDKAKQYAREKGLTWWRIVGFNDETMAWDVLFSHEEVE